MMELTEKYLMESKESEAISDLNEIEYNTLKRSYHGISDNIEQLGKSLNSLNGNTGLFGSDLKHIVKARDAFRKLSLGKHL